MMGKVIEWVVADQIQALFEKTDFLDPFQLQFKTGFGTKTDHPVDFTRV